MPKRPTDTDFLALVGTKAALWSDLRAYLASHYSHQPELSVGRTEHDWTIRYRRSGKTLVTLMPELDGFCVLVVLGKDEVAKARKIELNDLVRGVFKTAKQYHDGRWLWIRPKSQGDLDSITALLALKQRPSRT